jgi:hypothetical protein
MLLAALLLLCAGCGVTQPRQRLTQTHSNCSNYCIPQFGIIVVVTLILNIEVHCSRFDVNNLHIIGLASGYFFLCCNTIF